MRIDTLKHKPIPQAPQHLAHLSAEEPRPGAEEPGRLASPSSGVRSIEFLFHGLDLLNERGGWRGTARARRAWRGSPARSRCERDPAASLRGPELAS